MKNNISENLLKKDIKNHIINIISGNLGVCIGLNINPLYNFKLGNIDFLVHNKYNLNLFYNKNQELVIKIKEDEKIKVLSEHTTGCCFAISEIDITVPNLIDFYSLTAGLNFYYKLEKDIENKKGLDFYPMQINRFNKIINEFKEKESYFIFNLVK